MNIITGGTGHVGRAAAEALLQQGAPVTLVSHSPEKRSHWEAQGARFEVADVHDIDRLRALFRPGSAVFLLNPPAAPATDTDAEERRTAAALLEALRGSGVRKIVAASTLGAQPGAHNGDLGVLYELEEGIKKLPYPHSIIRSAYYMSNWDSALHTAAERGEVVSFYPADVKFPMVAPQDIGALAAALLLRGDAPALTPIQGPALYSAADVAAAFARALGREVRVTVVPPEAWVATYQSLGFSDAAAASYARMTEISATGDFEMPETFAKGPTTLEAYITGLVRRGGSD